MPFMAASSWETPVEQPVRSVEQPVRSRAASSWENPFAQPNPFRHLSGEVDESWHWPLARAAAELAPNMGAAFKHLRWADWPEDDNEPWDSDPEIWYLNDEERTWEEEVAVAEARIHEECEQDWATNPKVVGKKRVRRELGEQDMGKPAWKPAGSRQEGKKLATQ